MLPLCLPTLLLPSSSSRCAVLVDLFLLRPRSIVYTYVGASFWYGMIILFLHVFQLAQLFTICTRTLHYTHTQYRIVATSAYTCIHTHNFPLPARWSNMRRPQVSLDGLQHTLCTTRPTALPSLNARVLHASVFLGAPIVCPPVAPGTWHVSVYISDVVVCVRGHNKALLPTQVCDVHQNVAHDVVPQSHAWYVYYLCYNT